LKAVRKLSKGKKEVKMMLDDIKDRMTYEKIERINFGQRGMKKTSFELT